MTNDRGVAGKRVQATAQHCVVALLRSALLGAGVSVVACSDDWDDGLILNGVCREGCVVLADHVCDPYGVAAQGETVYWTSKLCGTVAAVPRAGGVWPTYLAGSSYMGSNGKTAGVAADATTIYVAGPASHSIYAFPVAGGAPTEWKEDPKSSPAEIAVTDAFVFWTNEAIDGAESSGSIMRSSLSGEDVTAIATAQAHPRSLAVSGGFVYWANFGTMPKPPATTNTDGAILRAPVGGGTAEVLVAGEESPEQLAVDATNVYWSVPWTGTIRRAPIGGGTPVTIASGQRAPRGIAVDARNVYWTVLFDETGNGAVMRAELATGTVRKLASDQNYPFHLAVDGTNVYWTDPGGDPLTGGRVVAIRAP